MAGMAEFLADLAVLQVRLEQEAGEEDNRQAGRIAGLARARGTALGSVHAHAAPAVKAVNQRPIIRLFTDEHPEVLGAEFGGGKRPTTRQFPPWRGTGETAGYMLYPTIREDTDDDEFADRYADIIQRLAGWPPGP